MHFDVFTIAALVDEMQARIAGGRVQKIYDLTEAAIGLEVYASRERQYLVLDADPAQPHVTLVEGKLRRGLPRPTQLGLLMRRFVEGGIIDRITQPPWERILIFDVDSPQGVSQIIVETMERRANILLIQEGQIVDCIRRVGPHENRVRVSLPGYLYTPPPPQQGKLPPDLIALEDIQDCLDSDSESPAWRTLTRAILGLSPVLAREIVFQATGIANRKAGDTSARAVFAAFEDLLPPLQQRAWQPGTTRDEYGQVTAYAPRPIAYLPGWQPSASMSEALTAYYGAPVGEEAYTQAKEPVQEQLREAIARVGHKVTALSDSLKDETELTRLRQAGELLLAYQYTIPPGAAEFSAQYDPEGPSVQIRLDPALSALENARAYFARYDKAKRALADVPAMLRAAENELAFLHQLEIDLAFAASWPEIDEVRDALERDSYWRGPRQMRPQGGKSAPLKLVMPEGVILWIGRNSRQNDQVTFTKGDANDLWLHARGVPGAHVIIKAEGRPVSEAVIQRAAELAAYFSAARGEARARVDVTRRKYVRKISGGKPGMVTYRHEETREALPRGPED